MNEIKIQVKTQGRTAYPVVPDPDDPIILQVDNQLMRVLEISASGFVLPFGSIEDGRRYAFTLDLPTAMRAISGYTDILPVEEDSPLHCVFVSLTPTELDELHRYALIRQKQAIRSLRSTLPAYV